jgi:hypothetical protein
LDLRQAGHHNIGTSLAERLRSPAAVNANDTAESAGATCLDSGDRILHDDRTRWFGLEVLSSLQESVGRWLAVEIQAPDI